MYLIFENFGGLKTLSEPLYVGRGAGCDFVIPGAQVSKQHCKVYRTEDGSTFLFDVSLNGTFVNGDRILHKQVQLKDGDRIQVGAAIGVFLEKLPKEGGIPTGDATVEEPRHD
jgi:predicted component of type VI protein secretion system